MDASLRVMQDTVFLALTLWREARGEPHAGKVAVSCSILNRVARPSWWGKDVLSVVTKKWQFSSITDPHDPQLTIWPAPGDPSWQECLEVAADCLAGKVLNPVPGADSYYDCSIPPPKWADPKCLIGAIGRIRFYDLDHDHERVTLAEAG